MRKKLLFLFLISIFCLFSGCLIFGSSHPSTEVSSGALRWVREQSFLVNSSVQDDRITLTYSFHFQNSTDDDLWVCYPQAKFNRLELLGWMEYDHISGYGEYGEDTFLIPANDEADIIVVFEGKYLGGTVNQDLSVPSIVFMQKESSD